jgi:hypothetical protein
LNNYKEATFNYYEKKNNFNQTQPMPSLMMQKAHSHVHNNKSMELYMNPFKSQKSDIEAPCYFGMGLASPNAGSTNVPFNPFKSAQKKSPTLLYGGGSPLRPRTGS